MGATERAFGASLADDDSYAEFLHNKWVEESVKRRQKMSSSEPSETVTILKFEYERLLAREMRLDALEAGGVDNWQGIDEAWRILRERQAEKAQEDGK
jgi:hypothetical protein